MNQVCCYGSCSVGWGCPLSPQFRNQIPKCFNEAVRGSRWTPELLPVTTGLQSHLWIPSVALFLLHLLLSSLWSTSPRKPLLGFFLSPTPTFPLWIICDTQCPLLRQLWISLTISLFSDVSWCEDFTYLSFGGLCLALSFMQLLSRWLYVK